MREFRVYVEIKIDAKSEEDAEARVTKILRLIDDTDVKEYGVGEVEDTLDDDDADEIHATCDSQHTRGTTVMFCDKLMCHLGKHRGIDLTTGQTVEW